MQVVIQFSFNDLRSQKKASTIVDDVQQCIQVIRVLYPNATILVRKILPHPNNKSMNNSVKHVNYFLKKEYLNLKCKVCFVEHPICRVDNKLGEDDRLDLHESLRTLQLLKIFQVSREVASLLHLENSTICSDIESH